jgi:hypothetical protein
LLNPGAVSKDGFVLLSAIGNESGLSGKTSQTTAGGSRFLTPQIPIPVDEYGLEITLRFRAKGAAGTTLLAYMTGSGGSVYPGISVSFTETGQWVYGTKTFTIPSNNANLKLIWYYNSSVQFGDTTVEILSSELHGVYMLPYSNVIINDQDHYLQNAYVAFCYLQNYYAFDMPAPYYAINGVQMTAQGIKKLKNQTIRFPLLNDPDLVELVKTNLGNGTIEKLSVNLSSRNANATLKYDTE